VSKTNSFSPRIDFKSKYNKSITQTIKTQNKGNLKMKIENNFGSPYFLKGYRSFVLGGRVWRKDSVSRNKTEVLDKSIDPFDHLSEKQKKEWRDGIEYAKQEREECRTLTQSQYGCLHYQGKPLLVYCKKHNINYNSVYNMLKSKGVNTTIEECVKFYLQKKEQCA